MLWNVTVLDNGSYIIQNAQRKWYACCKQRPSKEDEVVAKPSRQQWYITPTATRGRFVIHPTTASVYWGLSDEEMGTPVTLRETPTNPSNQWVFDPWIGDVPIPLSGPKLHGILFYTTRLLMRNRLLLSVIVIAFIAWTVHWRAAEVLGHIRPQSPADPESASFDLIQYQHLGYMGNDALPFNDAIEIHKLTGDATNITRISRIVVLHGPAIGALTITYQLSNGNEYTSKQHGFVWSALGVYAETAVELADYEILLSVHGRHNMFEIRELSFIIEDTVTKAVRTAGPFGNGKGIWWYPFKLDTGDSFRVTGKMRIIAVAGCTRKLYGRFEPLVSLAFMGKYLDEEVKGDQPTEKPDLEDA